MARPPEIVCCQEMRYALSEQIIVCDFNGYHLPDLDHMGFFHCPWCAAILNRHGKRGVAWEVAIETGELKIHDDLDENKKEG